MKNTLAFLKKIVYNICAMIKENVRIRTSREGAAGVSALYRLGFPLFMRSMRVEGRPLIGGESDRNIPVIWVVPRSLFVPMDE